MKPENKYLQINAACGLAGKKKGDVIKIKCTKVVEKVGTKNVTRYIPIDHYWRNRVKDSEIDKCVEFVDKPKPAKPDEEKSTGNTKPKE